MWQIAERDYKEDVDSSLKRLGLKRTKTVSDGMHLAIGEAFRHRFPYPCTAAQIGDDSLPLSAAGWAHTILFAADLHDFQSQLPEEQRKKQLTAKRRKRKHDETESDSSDS